MNQTAIALRLFWLDVRWRFSLGVYAVITCVLALVLWWIPVNDPALVDIALFSALCVSPIFGIQRIGMAYHLALPISPRTLFLTTLFVAGLTIWVPALSAAAFFAVTNCRAAIAVPLACGALWTAGLCALWLGWAKRQSPPTSSLVLVLALQVVAAFRWLGHTPTPFSIACLFVFSAAACVLVLVRLPPVFTIAAANAQALTRLGFLAGGSNASVTLARMVFPWTSLLFIPLGLLFASNWAGAGVWMILLYSQSHAKAPLLLSLPVSPLRLVYARMACAFLLVAPAPYVNPLGRLMRSHSNPPWASLLLSVAVALLLIAAAKLVTWHRLRRRYKGILLAVIPGSLFSGTLAIQVNTHLINRIGAIALERIAPSLLAVILLLLWLITIETRESDNYPSTSPLAPATGLTGE